MEVALPGEHINPKLVAIALSEVDTGNFERFAQAFYAGLAGKGFVALGGLHDGGAEGFLDPEVFSDESARHFIQVSKQEQYASKIRQTVRRLREVGREPASLTYITSRTVAYIDREEESLSDELSCRIRIRDGKYIETQINTNDATIASFKSYLMPSVQFLLEPGSAPLANRASLHTDRTLAVFLRQEVEHRRGRTDLLDSVADSLILWSLRDTDPEKKEFLTRDEILTSIESVMPTAKHYMRGVIDHRLEKLNERYGVKGRQIRFYRKTGQYCLPYVTRELISEENIEDASLKIAVRDVLSKRVESLLPENHQSGLIQIVSEVCLSIFERMFEKQGLQVAQFAVDGEQDDDLIANAADLAAVVVEEEGIDPVISSEVRRLALQVIRGTFYDSTEEERSYLEKLSRTYVLMLLLKNEPKIVEYFKTISSEFILYIGTDFVVRALSEHYLDKESQSTIRMMEVLRKAGAKLVLTEKTVEEVATHIRAQIFEFENVYSQIESKVAYDLVEYIDRILIRSYFYSRLAPVSHAVPPKSWRDYIEQFAPYGAIRSDRGDDDLARYLIAKFSFEYETTEEMERGVDEAELEHLKSAILEVRSQYGRLKDSADLLAYNDALHVLRVYQRRQVGREASPGNPFGFRTWWLTQDSKVRRAAAPVVAKAGQRFMMRPEFILNFIALSPSAKEIEDSYRTVFPSVLAMRLSNRVASDTFHKVMRDANEIWSKDEARASAMISGFVENLKGDNLKVYEHEF